MTATTRQGTGREPGIDRPGASDIAAVAARLGYDRAVAQAGEFATLIGGMLDAYDVVDGVEPEPPVRERVAHRRPGPDEDPDNAWVVRTEIRATRSGPLAGLRVAVKDNIMVAGLPMAAGSGLLAGYWPSFDATVVSRVLDAGASITGKTSCEYFCLDGGSHITALDPVIDHAGVMSTTVANAASLLSVVAGYDDYDPRQRRIAVGDYLSDLDAGVRGLRIGLLTEGFGHPGGEPDVDDAVRAAAAGLAARGAEVIEVSIPMHGQGLALWTPIVMHGMAHSVVRGQGFGAGRDDRYPVDAIEHLLARRDRVGEMPATVTACAILATCVQQRHGISYYARAVNAVRRLRREYDRALERVDLLLMPTTPHKARPMPAARSPVAGHVGAANDMFGNTAPFNATHHPALSLPCGEANGLPIGLMFAGRHFDEGTMLRAARACELAVG